MNKPKWQFWYLDRAILHWRRSRTLKTLKARARARQSMRLCALIARGKL
jgi:hypothetical protein